MVQSRKEHSKQTVCTDVAYNTRASLIPVLVYADLTAFWQNLRQKKGMYYFSIWKYKALTTLQKLTAKLQKVLKHNSQLSCTVQTKKDTLSQKQKSRQDCQNCQFKIAPVPAFKHILQIPCKIRRRRRLDPTQNWSPFCAVIIVVIMN